MQEERIIFSCKGSGEVTSGVRELQVLAADPIFHRAFFLIYICLNNDRYTYKAIQTIIIHFKIGFILLNLGT